MSAFNPVAAFAPNQQKQKLLDALMQQYQQSAQRSAGLGATGASGIGGTPVFGRATHPFGGTGLVVHPPHPLVSGLAAALGPGAMGIPAAAETSPGPGQAVSRPVVTNPHAFGNPAAAPFTVPGLISISPGNSSVPGSRGIFSPSNPMLHPVGTPIPVIPPGQVRAL